MSAARGAMAALALAVLGALPAAPSDPFEDPYFGARQQMVDLIRDRGVTGRRVLDAMADVPRHLFVPETLRERAYDDLALPIGPEQNILQPYLVALMAELLDLDGDERVLEIGTGSGYQAAVLAEIAAEVYTIEIVDELGERARERLRQLGHERVHVRIGDGSKGWPEVGPFDAILVTAASERVPQELVDQLVEGGRMVIPVGNFFQDLKLIIKTRDGLVTREIKPVRLEKIKGQGS